MKLVFHPGTLYKEPYRHSTALVNPEINKQVMFCVSISYFSVLSLDISNLIHFAIGCQVVFSGEGVIPCWLPWSFISINFLQRKVPRATFQLCAKIMWCWLK